MDFSDIRKKTGIVEEDIAKRLQEPLGYCRGPYTEPGNIRA